MIDTDTKVPFVDLNAQYRSLQPDLEAALRRVFNHAAFILGQEVASFEAEFAAYLGIPYAVGVSSGLDALRLVLLGLGIGPNDQVILPVNTYIATALAVSATGASPVLVDVDEERFGIDIQAFERAITPRTRAVIPVHLYGEPCDMEGVLEIAKRHGLFVVEDACQAHGAHWRGRPCGTLGDAGCFSFYPSKNLGAAGDGGMVVTHKPELAENVRLLRDYGQGRKYHHVIKGWSARLDAVQAALLRVKLPHLDAWNKCRAKHSALYGTLLANVEGIQPPPSLPAPDHIYHLYVIRVKRREALIEHLKRRRIQTGIHYPVPIHLQPAYADLSYQKGNFPTAERLAEEILSLPMYPELKEEQIELVATTVRDFYTRKENLRT
jgi:dTDP-4-amino-4,6-dideoxygalactose transaminase